MLHTDSLAYGTRLPGYVDPLRSLERCVPCGFSGETEEWELMFDDMAGLKKYLAQARKSRIGAEVELARHVRAPCRPPAA